MIPEAGVIFDAGTGMFRARDLICTQTLDIFLSHAHLDHSIGLTFLYDILFGKEEVESVTVHVAAEKVESIREHLYAKELFPVGPNFEFNPLPAGDEVKLSDGSRTDRAQLSDSRCPGRCRSTSQRNVAGPHQSAG